MRYEFQFDFAFQKLICELFVLAHIGGEHAFDLLVSQQKTNTEIVQTDIVRDAGQIFAALSLQCGDQVLRYAAQSESACVQMVESKRLGNRR